MLKYGSFISLAVLSLGSTAAALTPTLDGTINNVEYGAQVTTQTVQTQFGDASGTTVDSNSNGSELDNLSITDDANNVYFGFGGNIQVNGNGIALFIDVDNNAATGATTLPTDGFNEFNGYKMPSNMGVELAYYLNAGGPNQTIYMNGHLYSSAGASVDVQFFGSAAANPGNPTIGTISGTLNSVGPKSYGVALNNSNTAGVAGGAGLDSNNTAAVLTGAELAIPKSVLLQAGAGGTGIGTKFKAVAVIVGGGNPRFASNQVLPALPTATGYGNLGAPADLSTGTGATYTETSLPVQMSAYSLE